MQNANAQVVGYVGSSICNLFKLAPYLSEQGYNVQELMTKVMGELNGQLNVNQGISGGQHMDAAMAVSSQSLGAAKNMGLSR